MPEIENRWKNPNACDRCGKVDWSNTWEHIFPPDFTFVWCKKCEKDKEACDIIASEAIRKYLEWQKTKPS
jgi:hypothetical protein